MNVTSVHEHVPLGRPGDAREVGALIAFLASPEASYITGQSYIADGGLMLMAAMKELLRGASGPRLMATAGVRPAD